MRTKKAWELSVLSAWGHPHYHSQTLHASACRIVVFIYFTVANRPAAIHLWNHSMIPTDLL